MILSAVLATGCARHRAVADLSPVVFDRVPSMEEVAEVINRNDAVKQLHTNSATITLVSSPQVKGPGFGMSRLSASLAVERPQRLRMQVRIPLSADNAVDLGSNEDQFWMRVPGGRQPQLFLARHDEFAEQPHRNLLPIDPVWLIDALGLVHLDPDGNHEGPRSLPGGDLEIVSRVPQIDGTYRRILLVDGQRGTIKEQYLYAPSGDLVAFSRARDIRFDPEIECSLPHAIDLELRPIGTPPTQMKIEVGRYSINRLLSDSQTLFTLPRDGSEEVVDLARIGGYRPEETLAPASHYRVTDAALSIP
jgi:hypothetical protein